jgi:ribosomal protein L12E/L44/L45/RPP1/RPP2
MNTLNSVTQKQKTGSVKLEPRFHSAISAGLRGVSPKRIRVLRASLAAAAAAAAAAAVARGGDRGKERATQENRKRLCLCF